MSTVYEDGAICLKLKSAWQVQWQVDDIFVESSTEYIIRGIWRTGDYRACEVPEDSSPVFSKPALNQVEHLQGSIHALCEWNSYCWSGEQREIGVDSVATHTATSPDPSSKPWCRCFVWIFLRVCRGPIEFEESSSREAKPRVLCLMPLSNLQVWKSCICLY
jgi:hypothetical protein